MLAFKMGRDEILCLLRVPLKINLSFFGFQNFRSENSYIGISTTWNANFDIKLLLSEGLRPVLGFFLFFS